VSIEINHSMNVHVNQKAKINVIEYRSIGVGNKNKKIMIKRML
jgi:hypothetical protein